MYMYKKWLTFISKYFINNLLHKCTYLLQGYIVIIPLMSIIFSFLLLFGSVDVFNVKKAMKKVYIIRKTLKKIKNRGT